MKKVVLSVCLSVATLGYSQIRAHDTWVEAGSLQLRTGEYIYVDLRLGNHGNNHRDFKLASKITLAPCELSVIGPDGTRHNVKSKLVDTGNAEKEGRVEFTPSEGNLILTVAHFVAEDEKGDGFDKTHYGATIVLPVPQQKIPTK